MRTLVMALSLAGAAVLAQAPAPAPAPAAPAGAPPADPVASMLKVYVFPANNQTPDQQTKDSNECYGWAKQQTGVDPTNPTVPPKADTSKAGKGGAAKGAAKGAAGGAAVGAIAGDTGEGAAIGATVGAAKGVKSKKEAQAKAETQATQQQQQAVNDRDQRLQEGVHRVHGGEEIHREVSEPG